jgi:hypothetical protein
MLPFFGFWPTGRGRAAFGNGAHFFSGPSLGDQAATWPHHISASPHYRHVYGYVTDVLIKNWNAGRLLCRLGGVGKEWSREDKKIISHDFGHVEKFPTATLARSVACTTQHLAI